MAVVFTPYLGVKLLPDIAPVPGGHAAIYAHAALQPAPPAGRPGAVRRKRSVAGRRGRLFAAGRASAWARVKQQFFPSSDRPEVLVEVQMPEGTSIEATDAPRPPRSRRWLRQQPEAKIVTTYIGQGAPRFFLSYNPELPDPSFAKIVVLTPDAAGARRAEAAPARSGSRAGAGAGGAACASRSSCSAPIRRSRSPSGSWGPTSTQLRGIAGQVRGVMRGQPAHARRSTTDWGERAPTVHFVLDQDRLRLHRAVSPTEAAEQLQFLLTGAPVTQVREDIRTVEVVARSAGPTRARPGHGSAT